MSWLVRSDESTESPGAKKENWIFSSFEREREKLSSRETSTMILISRENASSKDNWLWQAEAADNSRQSVSCCTVNFTSFISIQDVSATLNCIALSTHDHKPRFSNHHVRSWLSSHQQLVKGNLFLLKALYIVGGNELLIVLSIIEIKKKSN